MLFASMKQGYVQAVRPHHKTELRQLVIDNAPVQVQTPVIDNRQRSDKHMRAEPEGHQ